MRVIDTLLHIKSYYSLGYGTSSPAELVKTAAAFGYRSVALTDLENLYGQVQFHHLCRFHGIHPITGIELRPGFDPRGSFGSKQGRLVLLAGDTQGYRSLCRMVSIRRGGVPGGTMAHLDQALHDCDVLIALTEDPTVVERLLAGRSFLPERLGLLLIRPESMTDKSQILGEKTPTDELGELCREALAEPKQRRYWSYAHDARLKCFQLVSPAMRSLLARIPIASLADMVAALALIRPGAAAGAGRVGGMTLAEADELRPAIVKSGGDPSISRAEPNPSPNTVWVPRSHRGQARQPAAASFSGCRS